MVKLLGLKGYPLFTLSYPAISDLKATSAFRHSHTLYRAYLDGSLAVQEQTLPHAVSYRVCLDSCIIPPDKSIVGAPWSL